VAGDVALEIDRYRLGRLGRWSASPACLPILVICFVAAESVFSIIKVIALTCAGSMPANCGAPAGRSGGRWGVVEERVRELLLHQLCAEVALDARSDKPSLQNIVHARPVCRVLGEQLEGQLACGEREGGRKGRWIGAADTHH
jgi:hypothetical protein